MSLVWRDWVEFKVSEESEIERKEERKVKKKRLVKLKPLIMFGFDEAKENKLGLQNLDCESRLSSWISFVYEVRFQLH